MREKEKLEGGCESEDFKCINYDREKKQGHEQILREEFEVKNPRGDNVSAYDLENKDKFWSMLNEMEKSMSRVNRVVIGTDLMDM